MTDAVKRTALLVALTLSIGATSQESSAPRAAAAADRGVLAVLRRDGIMLPFASFRGNSWTVPWPAGLANVELPINLESVPERWWGGWQPDSWRAWLADGTNRPIRALEPVPFRIHCAPRLGIRTDYKSAEAMPLVPVEPYPKDGLAATAGIAIESVEVVSRSETGWGALAIELMNEFNRAEDLEIASVANTEGWRHPVDRTERRLAPVRIESWYRTTLDEGMSVSYIEAVRSYPPRPEDNGCGLETLFSGWVYHRTGEPSRRPDLAARLTYCDRVNATYMLPFGRLRLKDRVYWIAQMSGYESEWYAVAEIGSRARIIAEYFAGSQASCR
jgi:hypothetical protein